MNLWPVQHKSYSTAVERPGTGIQESLRASSVALGKVPCLPWPPLPPLEISQYLRTALLRINTPKVPSTQCIWNPQ